jgi:hypothetical protein
MARAIFTTTVLLGACRGLTDPPARDDPHALARGSWQPIAEAPVGSYRPEGGFWIDGRAVVVVGSTVLGWESLSNSWERLADIPQAEECEGCGYAETVVWTGRELLLWGGGFSFRNGSRAFQGAAFEPRTKTLRPIPDAPVPSRWWHSAVWTGKEMIVWGGTAGRHERRDGAAYDPGSDA